MGIDTDALANLSLIKGFISYAHDDHDALVNVRTHLKPIERQFNIDFWADNRIKPGDYWTHEIGQAIDDAAVHVLLASPGFFASDYIYKHELPAINSRYRSGALVMPVVVKRCCWAHELGSLQATPMNPRGRLLPVSEWRPRDHGYDAMRAQMVTAIQSHFKIDPLTPDWTKP